MKRYFFLLIFISCLTFAPLLFTHFAFDDYPQIVQATQIHTIQNIPLYFVTSLQYPGQKNNLIGFFYRPIVYTLFAILYALGNGKPFLFHLFQLVLHTTNAMLLFYFFTYLYKKKVAFLLALIFLIHPVNETIVAYIADIPQALFFFFGMLALLIVKSKIISSLQKSILVSIVLFLSLLSKETGILFFIPVLLSVWCLNKKKLKYYFFTLSINISIYTVLRIIASRQYFLRVSNSAIIHASFVDRIRLMPEIIFFYMRELFLPRMFTPTSSEVAQVTSLGLLLQITGILFFCILLIVFGIVLWKKKQKQFIDYIFFFVWFVSGILFHLQLFSLDVLVAKRFLYFPLVGLLGLLGILLNYNFLQRRQWQIMYTVCIVLLVLVYMLTTIKMNTYWFSPHI